MPQQRVILLLGPTGVGKTALSLELAHRLGASIISADSRQIFKELPIGTAAPTPRELSLAPQHLIGHKSIHDSYSAGDYEQEALEILAQLRHQDKSPWAIVSGGSMMYLDALSRGIDEIPDVHPEVRASVWQRYAQEGLEGILGELKLIDPIYYERVDRNNYKRVLHGLEVFLSAGKPLSSYHTATPKARPFELIKIGLTRPREELYRRIDARVLAMMEQGLLEEARAVYPYKHLNALNTVGYKELFAYLDGAIPLAEAVRLIQRNTRHYARKQMTWWRRDSEIRWFNPEDYSEILAYINEYAS